MNPPFSTPPVKCSCPFSNVTNAKQKHSEDEDVLMREIDALEGAVIGIYSLTSQSQCSKVPTKLHMAMGTGNVILDDDLSSIGSQEEEDDDTMFLCIPSSQETQPRFMLTPSYSGQASVFSLTPRKANELLLLSIPQVSPMLPMRIVSKSSQKRKRE
jgi:hypothetical protein